MAVIRAFRALRPDSKYAEKVISLPYDVMNGEEAARMAEGNPYSFLHICRSEIDLPKETDPYSRAVYQKAKDNLDEFLNSGVFVREELPMLYLYRQTMNGRTQTGIVACVPADEYGDGTIKKHELTRVEKENDRIRHFDVCSADTEPVFLTYRDDLRIRSVTEGWIGGHRPEYDFITEDGIGHALWKVDDPSVIAMLTELFREIPALYIADGHHRSASAYKVAMKRRAEHPDFTGEEEFNYFMAAIFPANDLHIYDYNRVVRDRNGLSDEALLEQIADAGFAIAEKGTERFAPTEKHQFSLYLSGKWYELRASREIIPGDSIRALDVSILQERILAPILGIEDPRTDRRIDFVGGIRGLGELERRCASDMQLAFALCPVTTDELMQVADQGLVMPPKSTWFEPKLGSGLFLHEI